MFVVLFLDFPREQKILLNSKLNEVLFWVSRMGINVFKAKKYY